MGIVINRQLELELGEILSQMQLASQLPQIKASLVYQCGPAHQDRGFVIHRPAVQWDSAIAVIAEVGVSISLPIHEAISHGGGPKDVLLALGYSGWDAGQIEWEMSQNAWLSGPAEPEIMSCLPVEQRWRRAASLIGIDLGNTSHDVDHA